MLVLVPPPPFPYSKEILKFPMQTQPEGGYVWAASLCFAFDLGIYLDFFRFLAP